MATQRLKFIPTHHRYLARRTFADGLSPQRSVYCQIETTEAEDRQWTFLTFGGLRGAAVIRRTSMQAYQDLRTMSGLVSVDAELWERYFKQRKPGE